MELPCPSLICFTCTDNIELNILSIAADMGSTAEKLMMVAQCQRKAGQKAACFLLIVVLHFLCSQYDNWSIEILKVLED
jgi:hypothetical protein